MDLTKNTKEELLEILHRLLLEQKSSSYEKKHSLNQDLTFQYAQGYFAKKRVPFDRERQVKLGLVSEEGLYTNLALLLSDQCEHSIKCAIFNGEGKTNFRTRKEFSGSILRQLEGTYEYINLYNNLSVCFTGLEREEKLDYPEVVIREALMNGVLHRDYNYSGSVLVNLFTDRLEVISIGGLVEGLTISDVMRGISQTRNKGLANVFYRLKLVDSYGTGIQRILECYENKGKPDFISEQSSFVVVLPNMNVKSSKIEEPLTKELITERQVMRLFENKEMISRKDIEELLGCSGFPARKVLTSLIEKRKIQVVGKGRSTRYILV